MKFFLLRFINFTQLLYTSSVIINLEFVFLHLRLTIGENSLFLSVQQSSNLCVSNVKLLTNWSNRSPCSLSNGSHRSLGHGRRRLTDRQAFSLGVIDVYSVCVMKHLLECGVIVIHILGEPLLGELWVGQGLCEGLDISLHEVVVLGLITCEEVGVVKGVHLLSSEVRSVTTTLMVVEEVQEEVQEIKDEWEEEEVEGHGGLKVEETRSSWDDHEMTRTNETWATMWCAIMTTRTWLLDYAHMGSRVHQFTCQCSCALCGRCSGSWWSRCHWCRESSPRIRNTKCIVLSFWMWQSTFALVVRLYSVIVNFICGQIVAHFCIAKTCHLRCCLYTSRVKLPCLARDLRHGRQRVSIMFNSLFMKRTCFDLLGTGRFSTTWRSLGRSRQRVAPFYHDLGLDLVGSIGNFWIVEQLVPLVVEQLLNPILSSSHVSRRSWEEAEVTHILARIWLLQFPS